MVLKAMELFAGIGGMALAEQMAGIEVVALSEIEEFTIKVLKKNFPGIPILGDIKQITSETLRRAGVDTEAIDIISGGFPCQPFSVAGKRRGTSDDRDLWPEMFRLVREIKPTWVVGENVANFANMELDRTLFDLESIGYQTETYILPACSVDAPHKRNRTFIVANANSTRKLQPKGRQQDLWRRTGHGGKVLADTSGKRQEASKGDGQFSTAISSPAKWAAEPRVGRVADGVPHRMDRLKGLGNAVVPQQVLPIFQAIVQLSNNQMNDS